MINLKNKNSESMSVAEITSNITIEDLVNQYPTSIRFLMAKEIRCLRCGEPIWGTLRDVALEKGYSENSLPELIEELRNFLRNSD